jgi:hypothetical protein
MTKYLFSRLVLVFHLKFFFSWAYNAEAHLILFFDINEGLVLTILSYTLSAFIIITGVFTINLFFTLLHLTSDEEPSEIIGDIKEIGLINFVNYKWN